jgi:malonyl CoA-acyl carrier protein transacylase
MSKTAIIFPGQGAQKVGMAQDLYNNNDQDKAGCVFSVSPNLPSSSVNIVSKISKSNVFAAEVKISVELKTRNQLY